jgi:hypothetical protein
MVQTAKSSYIPIVVLVVIYILLGVFLFSYENYPIDDDWSYIKAAETFHDTGEMRFTSWTAMSLVFQIWWGTCFTKLFGFSIGILRLSTLLISLGGLIFLYLLLRELAYDWQISFLVVLLILFNPFSFPLNFTFFTDHFFISLLLASTYFYYKACKDKKDIYLLIASLTASCSVLVRQNGILIPVAVFIYLMVRERSSQGIFKRSFLTLLIPFTTLVAFTYWSNVIHGPTGEYLKQVNNIMETFRKPHLLAIKLLWRPLLILEFMGFCLLPVSCSLLPRAKELFKRDNSFLLLLLCLAGTIFYLLFELIGLYNTTTDLWLNGFRYAFISEYGYRDFSNILFFFYRIMDFLSIVSITYLTFLLIKHKNVLLERLTSPTLLMVYIGTFQLLFLLVTRYKFSRYYLVLIPFFIFIILEITRQVTVRKKVFIPLLAAYALFSFAVTQDVMHWNQHKWQMGQQLLDKGIASRKLSAGFAWDAWHCSQYSQDHPYDIRTKRGDIPWWIEELVPAIDPEYIISNSPLPTGFKTFTYFGADRYTVIESHEYFSLFYLRNMRLYVLKRVPPTYQRIAESPFYEFLRNSNGAHVQSGGAFSAIGGISVAIGGVKKEAWLQPSPSRVSFRLQLPHGRSRLKMALGMVPSCWDKPGDGLVGKILINDVLLENLFRETGAIRGSQIRQFFRARTFFLSKPRTYFMQFIDPQNNPADRKWKEISLDLSTFTGKVVDITFEVAGGPKGDDRNDEALWAYPIIERY